MQWQQPPVVVLQPLYDRPATGECIATLAPGGRIVRTYVSQFSVHF